MKKFLLLLALAASVACNTEDDNNNRQKANFGGTLTVTSNHPNSTMVPFEASDVRFELTEDNKGTFKLTMHEIRFAASMPMSLTIVIPELKYEDANEDGIYELTSTADPIVPYIGGKPYSAFEIPMFTGRLYNGALEVIFTCRNPRIPVGDETLDHKAQYRGTILL